MKFFAPFLLFLIISFSVFSQQEGEYRMICVGFYNLENLFDTINEEGGTDEECTPEGKNMWTPDRYLEKLDNMARAIHGIGLSEYTPDGAVLLGVCELENASVMQDLANTDLLKDRNYKFVHYNSPYYRGMDVALFYQPKYLSGILDGDTVHVIVNHWPSRSGGEKGSRPLREAAARLSYYIADSLMQEYHNPKIIVMGDLNDDPTNKSIKKYLKGVKTYEGMKNDEFYNPFEELHAQGIGSLAYRDSWNLFDQIIL